MEIITKVVSFFNTAQAFLVANAQDVLAVIGAVYTIALLIVKLTPTPKDNEILDKVYKVVIGLIAKLGIKK